MVKNQGVRDAALQDLALFYIYQSLEFNKAVPLIGQMHNRNRLFNVKLALIVANPELTNIQKNERLKELLQLFPEQTKYIQTFIHK